MDSIPKETKHMPIQSLPSSLKLDQCWSKARILSGYTTSQHLQLSITILDYDIDFGSVIRAIKILENNTSNQCLDYDNASHEHLALQDDFIILAMIPIYDWYFINYDNILIVFV